LKNDFYELDAKDGEIIKKQNHIIENEIVDYNFVDSLIVVHLLENPMPNEGNPEAFFTLLNLKGEIIGKAENNNSFNLPDSLFPRITKKTHWFYYQFLGRWHGFLLFLHSVSSSGPNGVRCYEFYFVNKKGEVIGVSTSKNRKIFGKDFCLAPYEHKKLRNGNIYLLGQEGKNALITELSVEELYKDALKHSFTGIKNE
jgi:hypothetical protein